MPVEKVGHALEAGPGPSVDHMRVEELDLRDAMRECSEAWSDFRTRTEVSPFLQPDYLAVWARTMGVSDSCRVVVARRGDELVGYGPFMIAEDPFGPVTVRTLRFIGNNVGSAGDVLYSDIAAFAPRLPITRAILEHALRWGTKKWDLGYIPPSSETHNLVHAVLGHPGGTLTRDSRDYVGRFLPGNWNSFHEQLSGNARRNFRRRYRRLAERGAVKVRVASAPELVRQTVREMIRNHRAWWRGTARSDWFGDERVERCIVEATGLLASQRRYLGFALELDGKPIAWNVGAWDGVRYFEQYISFDREFAEYAPGVLLGILVAKDLIDLGAVKIELGPGFDERKHSLGGVPAAYERLRGYRGWLRTVASIHDTYRRRRAAA